MMSLRRLAGRVAGERRREHGQVAGLAHGDLRRPEAAVGLERGLEAGDAGLDGGGVGRPVDDDLDGVGLAEREVAAEGVPALLGVLIVRVAGRRRAGAAGLHGHDGRGGQQQQGHGGGQPDHRPPHDAVREALPDAAVAVGAARGEPAHEGHARGVDAVAEQAQQRGEQRERGEQRGEDDEHRADAHADREVDRDDDHAEHGEDDRHAAEEDGPVGAGARGGDGVDLLQAAGALFPIAADDEQRVVDADGEAHRREDVQDEGVHGVELPDQGRERERQDDAEDAQDQRHERGQQGAEDDDQHDERRRQAEDLGLLHVALGELVAHLLQAGGAGLLKREVPSLAGGDDRVQFVDVVDGRVQVARHDHRDEHRVAVLRDQRRILGLVEGRHALDDAVAETRDLAGELGHVGPVGRVLYRVSGGPHDHELGHLLRAGDAVLDEALRDRAVGLPAVLLHLGRQPAVEQRAHAERRRRR